MPVAEQLFQVEAEVRREGGDLDVVRIGPKAGKTFVENFLVAINGQISLGNEKHFRNPRMVRALADIDVN